ncbi:hypothetical protein ACFOWU_08470 [Epilithonimonas zeae]|uniref:Uncharacterized protein n=1 Tax=Epilithonimonas zeae TaxID=1416779 RepID=A0A1N6GCE6_9FLAO|nr:hypothetical protein [Epilithonimonas zeae]SIO05188.1 hypothetical protein SAMN05444409_1768 [Epilithonimonas zeae]
MNRYLYNNLTIEVFNDSTFSLNSNDNLNVYKNIYFGEDAERYPSSKHGIKLIEKDEEINNCLIIGSGGGTSINENSSILDDDNLLVCCSDSVFSISILDLKLNWVKKLDMATCFKIFRIENDFVVHGELEISRIDSFGNIIWQFGGADIFVSLDEEDSFQLNDNHIVLKDFTGTSYMIDFDGEILN